MSIELHHTQASMTAERQQRRRFSLRFGKFLEDEFRRFYAESNYPKTRPLMLTGLAAVSIIVVIQTMNNALAWQSAAFVLGVLLPTLLGALICSYKEGAHAPYERLLALTSFWVGLMCTSMVARASINGTPYYFGAEVAWICAVWLVLGLPFFYAAITALTMSAVYMWGMLNWSFAWREVVVCSATLVGVNAMGAYCCFQLERAIRNAFRESRQLNELAERDGLTGLYNRRRYDENIDKIWRQSRRDQSQFALLLIDIDHFKAFNDLYGHQAGDDALKRVAEVIASFAQRPLDFAARFGGEEFALVLYGSAQEYGRDIPEQLRSSVEALQIPHADSTAGPYLTVSIGVGIISPGAERSLAGAIQLADEALYQAKEEGRNRIVLRESRHAHIQTGRFRAARSTARA